MKKSSLYLGEAELERLRRLAKREGKSQSAIIREAIAAYEPSGPGDRRFALTASWEGDGTSVADVPEEKMLEGFGA